MVLDMEVYLGGDLRKQSEGIEKLKFRKEGKPKKECY